MTKVGVQVVARPHASNPAGVLIVKDKTLIASFIDVDAVLGITGSGPEALFLAGETHPAPALVDIGLNGPSHCAPPYAPIRPMHP